MNASICFGCQLADATVAIGLAPNDSVAYASRAPPRSRGSGVQRRRCSEKGVIFRPKGLYEHQGDLSEILHRHHEH